jgi:hypothetical protein
MDAKELLVHQGGQRQRIKGFHTSIVDSLGIFYFTFLFEREILGQMPAFVISSQQKKCVWVANFKGPKVKNTFNTEIATIHVITEKLENYYFLIN